MVRLLALLLLVVPCLTACMLPDDRPRVSIEFGAVPELEGAAVLIDGKIVGKLERTGAATRISFPVEKGRHEVSLKHPQFDCQAATVNAELEGQKVRMLAEVGEVMSLTPGGKPVVIFRY